MTEHLVYVFTGQDVLTAFAFGLLIGASVVCGTWLYDVSLKQRQPDKGAKADGVMADYTRNTSAPDNGWYPTVDCLPEVGLVVDTCRTQHVGDGMYHHTYRTARLSGYIGSYLVLSWREPDGRALGYIPHFWRPKGVPVSEGNTLSAGTP